MAACHSTPAVQRLQLQDSTRIGYNAINGIGASSQKTLQQSTYPPHLLNWVYLAIAEQNPTQSPDQVAIRDEWSTGIHHRVNLIRKETKDLFSNCFKSLYKKNGDNPLENLYRLVSEKIITKISERSVTQEKN